MYLSSDIIVPWKSFSMLLQTTQGLKEHITKHAKAFKEILVTLASETFSISLCVILPT